MEEEIRVSKEIEVRKEKKGGKRNLIIKTGGGKTRSEDKVKKEHKDKVFFMQSLEHVVIGPKTLDNPVMGTRWKPGFLPNAEFQKKVLEGEGNELIPLRTFKDAVKVGSVVDPHYFDSGLSLENFVDRAAIMDEANKLITGENLPVVPQFSNRKNRKPRRRKPLDEKKIALKKARNREGRKCVICMLKADKRESEILITRCECPIEDGVTPKAIRVHMACMDKKTGTLLECKGCKKVRYLPVD